MIGRNLIYNLAGAFVPTLISLVVTPPYLHALGAERFGVIAMIWLVFGYFGLFDFGLSRATSNSLAVIKDRSAVAFAETFWTALLLNLLFGLIGCIIFLAAAPYAFKLVVDPELKKELARSIPWVALLIPLSTVSGVFNGVIEAVEAFLAKNILQILGSILFQPLPLLGSGLIAS